MAADDSSTYFKYAHPGIAAAVIFGMSLTHFGCFNPHVVPDQYMGPVGWLFRYCAYTHPMIIQVIYFLAWCAHVVEACYSIHLTKKKKITDPLTRFKWFFQTLIFGYGSLYYLSNNILDKTD